MKGDGGGPPTRVRPGYPDIACACLLGALTIGALGTWPHNLGASDEASYLYQAKRLLDGEVMYRDVFDFITPGWMYLMALLFRLFGTTIATARAVAAALQGLTVGLVYLAARRLGAGRLAATAGCSAFVCVAVAAWPIASQHWLSTTLSVLLLVVAARDVLQPSISGFPQGLVLGLLCAVQQQRGVPMGLGVGLWVLTSHLIGVWYGEGPRARGLLDRLLGVGAGVLAVVVPMLAILVARAGVEPVWFALAVYPFANYGAITHCPWGHVNVMTAWQASFTAPRALAALPLVLIPAVLRLGTALWLRRSVRTARILALLLCQSAASALSISYFPDFVHIAFVTPVFLIVAAEQASWAWGRISLPTRIRGAVAVVGMVVLVVVSGVRLEGLRVRLERSYPLHRETAFGRVAFQTEDEVRLLDLVQAQVDRLPEREIFAYPAVSHLYLLTGTHNPTPFGFFVANLAGPSQVRQAIAALERRAVPLVVLFFEPPGDPIVAWVKAHYEAIGGADRLAARIFRRRESAQGEAGGASTR